MLFSPSFLAFKWFSFPPLSSIRRQKKRPPALLFFADERGTPPPFPKDGEENTARRRAGKNGRRGLAAEKVIGGGIYTAPFGKRAIASFFWVGRCRALEREGGFRGR